MQLKAPAYLQRDNVLEMPYLKSDELHLNFSVLLNVPHKFCGLRQPHTYFLKNSWAGRVCGKSGKDYGGRQCNMCEARRLHALQVRKHLYLMHNVRLNKRIQIFVISGDDEAPRTPVAPR